MPRKTKTNPADRDPDYKALDAFAADLAGEVLPLMKPLAAEKVRECVEHFLRSSLGPDAAARFRRLAG